MQPQAPPDSKLLYQLSSILDRIDLSVLFPKAQPL
jgi:hypothetical protein